MLAGLALYVAVVLASDLSAVSSVVHRLGLTGWLVILGLSLVNYGLRFLRWQGYLACFDYRVPAGASLAYYLGGFAFTMTPGKAGDSMDFDLDFSVEETRVGVSIRLTTNYITNTIIVWAPPKKIKEIDELIELYETDEGIAPTKLPSTLIKLEYADSFEAMYALQDYIDVIWDTDKPSVDYLPGDDNVLIVKSKHPEDFPELEAYVREHIDQCALGLEIEVLDSLGVSVKDKIVIARSHNGH